MSDKEINRPKCFIIMPISFRKDLVAEYHGGEDHFVHVLHHFFSPAVTREMRDTSMKSPLSSSKFDSPPESFRSVPV